MKALYPASNDHGLLQDALLDIKIARHSPCSVCTDCSGLHPALDVELDRDDGDKSLAGLFTGYGDDDDDDDDGNDDTPSHLAVCACGHEPRDHGAFRAVDRHEYNRRALIAVRLDAHLESIGKLLDFAYVDEEITALRHEMVPATTSVASPLTDPVLSPARPAAARTTSTISSHHSDDDEGQPRAKRRRLATDEDDAKDEAEIEPEGDANADGEANANEGPPRTDSAGDASEDEEDQPLALVARSSAAPSARPDASKKSTARRTAGMTASMKTKAHTAPISVPPPTGEMQAVMNGEVSPVETRLAVKLEEQMDDKQLDRLATGVTVDTESSVSAGPSGRPEKMSSIELRKGVIKIIPVENDGEPRSLVILTNLKTLFQKQLPVMPREYIARLVFDTASKCLAICKRGYKVVGGICYRPFPHRGFAEIVFFATASIDQEKGYGAMLMNHFKMHIRRVYPTMMYFLTYADNFAVGYFRKQGFTKDITLDRAKWAGYIKDYEGGTIMQCTLLPKIDYTRAREIIAMQREAILSKIRQMSKSHIVYEGLPQFQPGAPENVKVDPQDVPGLRESGWTPDMVIPAGKRPEGRNAERSLMNKLLSEMQAHPSAWPFLQPVVREEVPDYYDVIEEPMDLATLSQKVESGQYTSIDAFVSDARLIFDNCRFYNPEDSIYAKSANKLEECLDEALRKAGVQSRT